MRYPFRGLLIALISCWPAFASAQTLGDRLTQPGDRNGRLYVEMGPQSVTVYDRRNDIIRLRGDVKIYFNGRVLEADNVIYNRKTNRVAAVGNAHVTERDGTRYYANNFELTDDFRDGFVDHFRGVTPDNIRVSSPRVERTDGEQTVFENGTYTPCLPCREHPEKAPLWQLKANKMIAKNSEQMLYFEDARLEFWGVPVVYLPYFSTPDSSVTRKTGFLTPSIITNTALGYGFSTPYFFNLAPNYDLTITPSFLSRQGVLLQGEWRHRLESGQYDVKVAGIYQLDPSAFRAWPNGPGDNPWRGSISSRGEFEINDKWRWGWAVSASTDKFFYRQYGVETTGFSNATYLADSTSTLYLTGQGERSWFDLRGYYFQSLSASSTQDKIPFVAPAFEYDRKFETPLGAEFGVRVNAASLRREQSDFSRLSLDSNGNADPGCLTSIGGKCSIIGGIGGTTTKLDALFSLRKAIVDPIGQVWTPFAAVDLRSSAYTLDANDPFGAQQQALFGTNEDKLHLAAQPTIGLDYRYPFFAATDFGSHVIEPVAQIIASTDEMNAGIRPNEDSQLFVFDDTNLFEWNRFSGSDRRDGGVRANLGLQYSWNMPNGGWVNLFGGRSFHLAGKNSYIESDGSNAGRDSGLDKGASDYVARAIIAPVEGVALSARGQFDSDDFELKRIEASAALAYDRFGANVTYARFAPQPQLGFDRRREGLALNGSVKITDYWTLQGGVVFDLDIGEAQRAAGKTAFANDFQIASSSLGLTYADECTTFSANWTRSNSLTLAGLADTNDTFMFRLDLRSLGDVSYSYQTKPDSEP